MTEHHIELPLPTRVDSWNPGELHITWGNQRASLLIYTDGRVSMGNNRGGTGETTEQFINRLLGSLDATNS